MKQQENSRFIVFHEFNESSGLCYHIIIFESSNFLGIQHLSSIKVSGCRYRSRQEDCTPTRFRDLQDVGCLPIR